MALVDGYCDPQFQGLRDLFEKNILSGLEVGASLSVNVDGRDVVNLWGGHADANRTRPWVEDTIVNMFSTTKIVSSLALLKLVDNGDVSIDDKIAKHWPEFAENGKENVEVRHLLSHSSGVAGWARPVTMEEICDVEKSTAELAKQPLFWEPGTAQGYHCWAYGHLIGEIVRRVTGLGLRDFVAKELAGPVQADLQIGCKEEDWPRIAELIPPPSVGLPPFPPDSVAVKIWNPVPDANLTANFALTPTWRLAEVGAANGHGNAQACVRLFSAITLASDGTRLLSEKTVESIFQEQIRGVDLGSGMFLRRGLGLALRGEGDTSLDDPLPAGRIGLWGGWGGSLGIMDLDRKVTISYIMNKMSNEIPVTGAARAYIKEIYKSIGVEF